MQSQIQGFFLNPAYNISKKERWELLKSVCYYVKDKKKRWTYVTMFCYSDERCGGKDCYDEDVIFSSDKIKCVEKECFNEAECTRKKLGCRFVKETNCPASSNEEMMRQGLKEFANFLYELRSRYVHNARMFGLPVDSKGFMGKPSYSDYIARYEFRYIKKPPFTGVVVLMLSPNALLNILDCNFKKLLNEYIAARFEKSIQHDVAQSAAKKPS